jgi:hypothetical protein
MYKGEKMLNKEVFEKFGMENWVIEENLCYLLQEYAERLGVPNPYSPVAFVKDFMQEETYVNTKYAEMSAVNTAKKNIVADYEEGEYKEVQPSETTNKSFRRDFYADKSR